VLHVIDKSYGIPSVGSQRGFLSDRLLDGKYRLSSDGLGLRGYWADPQTFIIEIFQVGLSTLRLHFEDDRVVLDVPELGIKSEGQQENP